MSKYFENDLRINICVKNPGLKGGLPLEIINLQCKRGPTTQNNQSTM